MVKRFLRFGITGVFVTLVHIVVATAWMEVVYPLPSLANTIAFIVATVVSLVINTFWSFSSTMSQSVLLKFFVVSGIGLVLSAGISGLVDAMGFAYPYGIAAVVCTMPPVNFLLHHFWTYRSAPQHP